MLRCALIPDADCHASSALDLLAAHRFFHDLPPTQLETLSASLQSCRFPAGDLPFRSGEQARRCLLLGDGGCRCCASARMARSACSASSAAAS
ncbi:hypothetical protein P4193_25500 [Pseudomonas aeruginosa]|nr:hypothetical protein [Pseudomonas aeruginosa]